VVLNSQRFCTDCKWVDKTRDLTKPINWTCKSPELKTRFDVVTGKPIPQYCNQVRLDDKCGPTGKLWEAGPEFSEGPY
jgi:hypothetical protein